MTRHTAIETVRTIDLEHEQLLVLDDRQGSRARVLFGGAWLTEQGRPDDRFARAGDELELTEPGRAVLESIGRSRVEITQRHARPAATLRARMSAWLAGSRLMLGRGAAGLVSLVVALAVPGLVASSFQNSAAQAGTAHAAAAPAQERRA